MSAPVFLTEPGLLDGHGPGDSYVLEGAEARHAGTVQRRRPGERVDVADGAGLRLTCVIARVEPSRVVLDVVGRVSEPVARVRLVLAQALAKGDRDERAIEAATEVGVDEVVPWQAARSIVVWRGDRAARSRAKWLATVRAATKQSRRAWAPTVAEAVDTAGLAARVRTVTEAGGLAVVLHEAADAAFPPAGLPAAGEVLVVVGPEGGITEQEVAALVEAGARTARMGPTVMRTSTAGPVALAVLAQHLGRWT